MHTRDEAIRRGNGALTPMRERKTSKHGNRGANPNSTTLCISHFSSPTLVTTETITRKSKSPKPRHLGKAHGRKAPAKFTCATTFTRTYCIRPILESTGPTAQRADNRWSGIQLERVDCSFMQNVPLSAPLYRLGMLCTCRGASGESGSGDRQMPDPLNLLVRTNVGSRQWAMTHMQLHCVNRLRRQ